MWMNIQPALKIVELKVSTSKLKARIEARRQGTLASIAHALGIGSTHTLSVSSAGVRRNITGFFSESSTFVPLAHVSAVVFQTTKPFEWLGAASGVFISGVSAAAGTMNVFVFLGALVLAIIFAVMYFVGARRTVVGVVADAGNGESIRLKANAAEIEDLQEIAEIIEALLQGEKAGGGKERGSDMEDEPPPRASTSDADVVECDHCGRRMHISPAHRGKQVRCPSCKNVMQL